MKLAARMTFKVCFKIGTLMCSEYTESHLSDGHPRGAACSCRHMRFRMEMIQWAAALSTCGISCFGNGMPDFPKESTSSGDDITTSRPQPE